MQIVVVEVPIYAGDAFTEQFDADEDINGDGWASNELVRLISSQISTEFFLSLLLQLSICSDFTTPFVFDGQCRESLHWAAVKEGLSNDEVENELVVFEFVEVEDEHDDRDLLI